MWGIVQGQKVILVALFYPQWEKSIRLQKKKKCYVEFFSRVIFEFHEYESGTNYWILNTLNNK